MSWLIWARAKEDWIGILTANEDELFEEIKQIFEIILE